MVRVWSNQSPAAYEAAQELGAFRASPEHLENKDFCNPDSYNFMARELETRVGPCPPEVVDTWNERGGSGTPSPVWVWLQYESRAKPAYVPNASCCGRRSICIEAEINRGDVLGSQFGAFHHVLNDCMIPLTEEEDDELRKLKDTEPERWQELKVQSWQRIFDLDWQGEEYCLQRADAAQIQGVLWQLPMPAVQRARRIIEIGESRGTKGVEVDYSGVGVGDDVQLRAEWISVRGYNPPLHLCVTVTSVTSGGRAEALGVREGWTVACILTAVHDEDPLPLLVEQQGVHVSGKIYPKNQPPPAAELREQLQGLRGVQVFFEGLKEPDSDSDSDSGREIYDESQQIPVLDGLKDGSDSD
ncbi:EXOSC7 [Symbiodinium natans]|uniref:EXOSC7 protein n=1 Tax=Symbiodinium natans TaxID=878477 RepID=A0A812PYF4_9DINO|nr:EXOSC7 [Symbiodinium natans]